MTFCPFPSAIFTFRRHFSEQNQSKYMQNYENQAPTRRKWVEIGLNRSLEIFFLKINPIHGILSHVPLLFSTYLSEQNHEELMYASGNMPGSSRNVILDLLCPDMCWFSRPRYLPNSFLAQQWKQLFLSTFDGGEFICWPTFQISGQLVSSIVLTILLIFLFFFIAKNPIPRKVRS
jgi:hypothetical protein